MNVRFSVIAAFESPMLVMSEETAAGFKELSRVTIPANCVSKLAVESLRSAIALNTLTEEDGDTIKSLIVEVMGGTSS